MLRDNWTKYMRWRLAKETGWTLEYIDALSFGDVWEFLSIRDGEGKAYESKRDRAKAAASRTRRRGRRR